MPRCTMAAMVMALLAVTGLLAAPAKVAVTGPNCNSVYCALYSPHIQLVYERGITDESRARGAIEFMESLRTVYYQRNGFLELPWLKKHKLVVSIEPLNALANTALSPDGSVAIRLSMGLFLDPKNSVDPRPRGISERDAEDIAQTLIRATIAHELFHVVQSAYSLDERGWLYEATATTAEYVFVPATKTQRADNYGYRYYWRSLVRNVASSYPVTADARSNAYAMGSAFFSYLAERTPNQAAFLKTLWERAGAKAGDTTYDALAHVVGDAKPWGKRLQERVVEFATAVFLRDPDIAPHGLRFFRKKGIEPAFTMHTVGTVAYAGYNGGDLALERRFARGYGIDYKPLVLASNRGSYGGRFSLAVRGLAGGPWAFRILRNKAGQKSWDVTEPSATDNGWSILQTDGADAGDRFVVTAVNLKPNPAGNITVNRDDYAVVGVMTSPLILESIEAFQAPGASVRPVWSTKRLPEVSTVRGTTWRTQTDVDDGFLISDEAGQPLDGRVVLRFNRPVFTSDHTPRVEVTLGNQSLVISPSASGDGREVVARIDLRALSRLLDTKRRVELPIKVEAYDLWNAGLDGDPATPVYLAARSKKTLALEGWEGQGSDMDAPGGIDTLGNALITMRGRPAPSGAVDSALEQGLTGCWTTSAALDGKVRIYAAGGGKQVVAEISYADDRPETEMPGSRVTLRYSGTFSWPVLKLRHPFRDKSTFRVFGNYSSENLVDELFNAGVSSTYTLRFQPVSEQQADEMQEDQVFDMIHDGRRGLWQLAGTWWPYTHWHVGDDSESGFRIVEQSRAPEDLFNGPEVTEDYWQPTNDRWLSDLASVEVMTPDFTKPLAQVRQGERIGIRVRVRQQCDLMVERLKIDLDPVDFAYGEEKTLTLFETAPESGVFRTPAGGVLVDFDYPHDIERSGESILIEVNGRFYNNDSDDQPSVTLAYQPPRR